MKIVIDVLYSVVLYLSYRSDSRLELNTTKIHDMINTYIDSYKDGQHFVAAYFNEGHFTTTVANHQAFDSYDAAESFEAKVRRFDPTLDQLAGSDLWTVTSVAESYELQCDRHAVGSLDMDREF